MAPFESVLRDMPDIANEVQAEVAGQLAWVGMNEIEMPVRIEDDAGGLIQSSALVTAYVNLVDPDVRGIHMSRLYLHLDQGFGERPLNPCTLRQLLRSFLESHEGLSDRALIRVDFDYVTRRTALESDNVGWRRYPVSKLNRMRRLGIKSPPLPTAMANTFITSRACVNTRESSSPNGRQSTSLRSAAGACP